MSTDESESHDITPLLDSAPTDPLETARTEAFWGDVHAKLNQAITAMAQSDTPRSMIHFPYSEARHPDTEPPQSSMTTASLLHDGSIVIDLVDNPVGEEGITYQRLVIDPAGHVSYVRHDKSGSIDGDIEDIQDEALKAVLDRVLSNDFY